MLGGLGAAASAAPSDSRVAAGSAAVLGSLVVAASRMVWQLLSR